MAECQGGTFKEICACLSHQALYTAGANKNIVEVNLEVSKQNTNKKATPLYFPQRFQASVSKECL